MVLDPSPPLLLVIVKCLFTQLFVRHNSDVCCKRHTRAKTTKANTCKSNNLLPVGREFALCLNTNSQLFVRHNSDVCWKRHTRAKTKICCLLVACLYCVSHSRKDMPYVCFVCRVYVSYVRMRHIYDKRDIRMYSVSNSRKDTHTHAYSKFCLECHSISTCNLNLIGFVSTQRSTRGLENFRVAKTHKMP